MYTDNSPFYRTTKSIPTEIKKKIIVNLLQKQRKATVTPHANHQKKKEDTDIMYILQTDNYSIVIINKRNTMKSLGKEPCIYESLY